MTADTLFVLTLMGLGAVLGPFLGVLHLMIRGGR